MSAPFTFRLPPELSAKEPPERRGISRDQVRLLVIDRASGKIEHSRFDKIDNYLRENDLLVFNSSRTLPASLRGCDCSAAHGPCMEVRLAERLPDDSWLALLLCEQGDPFGCGLRPEMQIVLHAGLSSYMDGELDAERPASEEEYFVSATTAEKINRARENGGRAIAVGTTVVRALESVVDGTGRVQEQHGYTRLKIDNHHRLKAVDGLLTGLHEPETSHLELLSAFLPVEQICAAYEEAIAKKYLWHEFGDLNLIL